MHTDNIKQGFGLRLRRIREREGLSLADLEARLGESLSRQAIHKYEKGQAFPSSKNLLHLCEALNVSPDDVLAERPREFEEIEFRRLSKFSVADQRKLRGSLEIEFERMHQLNESLGLKPNFEMPLKNIGMVSSREDAENAASRLRKEWNLGHDAIPSVIELLESKGIHVHLEQIEKPFYGVSGKSGGIPVVALNNHPKITDHVRLRFTAAHELGHLVMQINPSLSSKEQEAICNRFAGAFLIPADTLKQELGPGKRTKLMAFELAPLKSIYGISIAALYQRAAQIGIINVNQLKAWNIYSRRVGWHINEPGVYQGKESPRLLLQHLLRALAEECISVSKAAAIANRPIKEIRELMMMRKEVA